MPRSDCFRSWKINCFALGFAACLSIATLTSASAEEGDWPRFRGPMGTGVSNESPPIEWTSKGIAWKTDLPVEGHSSPIVAGDAIYLTGFKQQGGGVARHVVRLNRKTGKVEWNALAGVSPGESIHKMNSWATPSCATDGERVYAFFGAGGLYCFAADGHLVWSRKLGDFPGAWGVGASPVLYGDTVIQNCDAAGDSFIIALDKKTGAEVWKTDRRDKPRGGWSTPVLMQTDSREELVVNGEFGVQAYNPKNGEPLWFCKSFNGRGTPCPVYGDGLVIVVNGKPGDVYAVRPGGTGDVTDTHMQWHTPRSGARDLPSPTYHAGVVFVPAMNGVTTCYDVKTGRTFWKQRLAGNFSASPLAADGRFYALAENGDVYVLEAGPKFEVLARNTINAADDEVFRSSMAASHGQLLIRSNKRLYCVAAGK